MFSLSRPFVLIAKGMRAFFKADLRLRRGGDGLRVALDERPVVTRRSRKQRQLDAAALKAKAELQSMRQSLRRLLDEMPENRTTMRHLAFIEHAFDRKGSSALRKVPYDVLSRARDQLEGLITNWSDAGLATLRSKMAVTLIEREAESDDEPALPLVMELDDSFLLDSVPPAVSEFEQDADAETALLRVYGGAAMPELEFATEEEPALEVQGELKSPSRARHGA